MTWYQYESKQYCTLTLYIQPGAKRTEVSGLHGDALKIKIAAAPTEGKANAALVKYLAKCFGVPRNQVVLKHGATSRRKVVLVLRPRYSPDTALQVQQQ
ncbi:DUF167 domain-containing protein [Nitrosomonas marina]|uniref:UPF0235 protein SAMN05216325_104166 n=1 Tax=Nitrosomonas marina TaxID=917 RepID=A0A1H8CFW0_9PROT|nr:DUF167 domain-containing protein [Nitrosomonas marina]SEM93324.1 hypothetical protein SAMN05216325_104166 [Nitrosomonas marina]